VSRRAWAKFAAVSVLWGLPYLFTSIAVAELPPVVVACIRTALGALVLLPLAWRLGALTWSGPHGLRDGLRPVLVLGALDTAVPFWLVAWGQQAVSSSLAGVLVASVPLFVALLVVASGDPEPAERLSRRRMVGLAVGIAGVALLLGVDVRGERDEIVGAAAVLAASASYAAATLYFKRRFADVVTPVGVIASALAVGALLLTPAAAVAITGTSTSALTSRGLAALAALGVACTGGAFWLYYALVVDVGATRAAVVTYTAPLVAVLAGVTVLGEPLTVGTVAGLLLVLTGSKLATAPSAGRREDQSALA
jgi:drug/metabolite transporter (DMT)-like permease